MVLEIQDEGLVLWYLFFWLTFSPLSLGFDSLLVHVFPVCLSFYRHLGVGESHCNAVNSLKALFKYSQNLRQ